MQTRRCAMAICCLGLVACGKGLDLPFPERLTVSAGRDYNCLHRTDGTIECWGSDEYGQSSGAPGGKFAAIDTGPEYACGVRPSGKLACWGTPYGQKQDRPPSGRFVSVSVGSQTACALDDDGELTCWGCEWVCVTPDCGQSDPAGEAYECWSSEDVYHNGNGIEAPLPAGPFVSLDIVDDFGGCAMDEAGELTCWGWILGDLFAPPSGPFVDFSLGLSHGCALTHDGELVCWSDFPDFATTRDGSFLMVSATNSYTAALGVDGAIEVWSIDPTGPQRPIVTDAPTGTFEYVALGDDHGCAVTPDSRIECWGERAGATPPP